MMALRTTLLRVTLESEPVVQVIVRLQPQISSKSMQWEDEQQAVSWLVMASSGYEATVLLKQVRK